MMELVSSHGCSPGAQPMGNAEQDKNEPPTQSLTSGLGTANSKIHRQRRNMAPNSLAGSVVLHGTG